MNTSVKPSGQANPNAKKGGPGIGTLETGRLRRLFVAQPIGYVLALAGVALCTIMALPFRDHTPSANLAMIYVTGVVVIAARFGLGPSVWASLLSVPAFNIFFTKPYYSLHFYDRYYYFTLACMLITSLLVGSLTARLSLHLREVNDRERETKGFYDVSRALSAERSVDPICQVAIDHLTAPYQLDVTLFIRSGSGITAHPESALRDDMKEMRAVNWVLTHGQTAGRETEAHPTATGLYLPLVAEGETIGALGLLPNDPQRQFSGEDVLRFGTVASLVAGALLRAQRSDEALQLRVDSENERLRNVLLSSLSHDLRTPLTVINNSVSSLLRMRKDMPRKAMDELTGLWGQLNRLQKFVGNLLNMAAITSGQMQMNFQPYLIQEIMGAALTQTQTACQQRTVRTQIKGLLPIVQIDGALIEQVLVNLIENACQHTADDGEILIFAEREDDHVRVRIADNGQGLKDGDETHIFEQFQSGQKLSSDRSGGTGLGLAICRGIITAHGGTIYARNNATMTGAPTQGASFIFTLPIVPETP